MSPRHFLVGNLREKKKIDWMLLEHEPAHITYDYSYLCDQLSVRLLEAGADNYDDFDFVLSEFLDEMEVDIRERLSDFRRSFLPYLNRVEESMHYFKCYLEMTSCYPIPKGLVVNEGTRNTVLQLSLNEPEIKPYRRLQSVSPSTNQGNL